MRNFFAAAVLAANAKTNLLWLWIPIAVIAILLAATGVLFFLSAKRKGEQKNQILEQPPDGDSEKDEK